MQANVFFLINANAIFCLSQSYTTYTTPEKKDFSKVILMRKYMVFKSLLSRTAN